MDFIDHPQGTQAMLGSTLVGIMRVGHTGEGSVVRLMIRSREGDLIVTAFEGDEIAIPGDGSAVVGPATAPEETSARWRIALAHRPSPTP
ncbi:hypothetical protein [uncultured Brachybacterium sp.]|uniref:hypothetical protein n=1 Tax=uncultured Brachybacterium sp. TaxID=189680 RepID=UPI00261FD2BE|nr:hypothetical protein [uncultured Brachybacterium sp.]